MHSPLAAPVLLAALLLAPAVASAVPPSSSLRPSDAWRVEPTPEEWGHLLESSRPADRRLASRELRRLARQAVKRTHRTYRDPLDLTEAEIALEDLRGAVSGSVRRAMVSHPNVRGACADIAVILADDTALTELRVALKLEERGRVRERLQAAIVELESR